MTKTVAWVQVKVSQNANEYPQVLTGPFCTLLLTPRLEFLTLAPQTLSVCSLHISLSSHPFWMILVSLESCRQALQAMPLQYPRIYSCPSLQARDCYETGAVPMISHQPFC